MANKTLATRKKTNSNPSPNANPIGLHPKVNLVPSTFSSESAGTIFANSISAKPSNFPISLPMSGWHLNQFVVARTLPSNQPTKAGPSLYGVPTFTYKEAARQLADSYQTKCPYLAMCCSFYTCTCALCASMLYEEIRARFDATLKKGIAWFPNWWNDTPLLSPSPLCFCPLEKYWVLVTLPPPQAPLVNMAESTVGTRTLEGKFCTLSP